jgi:hypothetical protein
VANVRHLISNFTAGEFSPRLYGRPDIAKYKNAVKTLENMTVVPHGGARKRPGTKFVVEVKDSDDPVRLVPFQYNTEQAYMLAFGPSYVWFCKDQGVITHVAQTVLSATQADPCVLEVTAHGFTNGNFVHVTGVGGMHQINNRRFEVANTTTDTFELLGVDATGYDAFTTGGSVAEIVELATTYTADEIDDLQFAQSADTLYIVHPNHPPAKITRTSHTAWTLVEVDILKGPFRTINTDADFTLTPSSFSESPTGYGTMQVGATFTLTASEDLFDAGHVDALFRLAESSTGETGIGAPALGDGAKTIADNDSYTFDGKVYGITNLTGDTDWLLFNRVPSHDSGRVRIYGGTGTGVFFDSDYLHNGTCVIRITQVNSATVALAEIVHNQMPASIVTGSTSFWEEGAFSDYRGFPRAITFFEQRLFMAGTLANPQTVYASRTGLFEDFEDGADDDDALVLTVASGQVDVIRWLSAGRLLTCGTASGEFAIAGTTSNDALTPTNVRAVPQTNHGSSSAQPIRIGQIILYPQRSGDPDNAAKKLREFAYQYESDAFQSNDLTVFSEHITGDGIVQLAYQMDPDSIVWARRSDGKLAAMTYEREQQVVAWHLQEIAGTDAEVESIATIPGADGDEVWVESARTINGATRRHIEVMQPAMRASTEKADAFFLDSGLTYSGASTSSLTGLWHLEGESVDVLNNGSVERAHVVTNGAISLTNATTKATVGLRYTGVLETLDLEAGAQAGTAQSRKSRIGDVFIRLYRSLGGRIVGDHSDEIEYRFPEDLMDASPPLFSGLKPVASPSGWEEERTLRFEHDEPLPFFVTGIVAEISTSG